MGKKLLRYYLLCLCIYLILAGIEIFLLPPLIDLISTSFRVHLIIELILLVIIDPPIVYLLSARANITYEENKDDA